MEKMKSLVTGFDEEEVERRLALILDLACKKGSSLRVRCGFVTDSQWLDLRLGLVRGPVLTTPIVTGGVVGGGEWLAVESGWRDDSQVAV